MTGRLFGNEIRIHTAFERVVQFHCQPLLPSRSLAVRTVFDEAFAGPVPQRD